ncbi:hypothetical protein PAHAL_6G122800 [Panicum hallii]|jgi:hypothetical protein|uniref:Uncharacterized protein n=1 Tax=Panicum hallii TaxID=206008 RepID=A0A2S3I1P0_9POAL|nr:hypothetical protein PAHAL_6G122800 [Panicum hallii]
MVTVQLDLQMCIALMNAFVNPVHYLKIRVPPLASSYLWVGGRCGALIISLHARLLHTELAGTACSVSMDLLKLWWITLPLVVANHVPTELGNGEEPRLEQIEIEGRGGGWGWAYIGVAVGKFTPPTQVRQVQPSSA